jgi:hypothetical protein
LVVRGIRPVLYTLMYPQNANPNHFSLVEVMLDKGVSERELTEDEKPWLIIQKKRQVCTIVIINVLLHIVKYTGHTGITLGLNKVTSVF